MDTSENFYKGNACITMMELDLIFIK